MTIEQLKDILKNGSPAQIHDALEAFPNDQINQDIFEIFISKGYTVLQIVD